MSELPLLLARQPILDRDLRVAGYELLFRGTDEHAALVDGADQATASVIVRALLDVGLDTLIGSSRAWINVSRDFLVTRAFLSLPPERVVIEVLEDVTAEEPVLAAMRDARQRGFRIALDDFELDERNAGLIAECDMIKVDVYGRDREQIERVAAQLRPTGRRLLAEKVETRETFDTCVDSGFELFQGYFFARPSPVRGRALSGDRARLMMLLAELNDPKATPERITALVQKDITLAHRLVRYVNSAAIGRQAHISRLRDAVHMLGVERVRTCATLMILAAASDKPAELSTTALVRARYCQLLGATRDGDPQKHFLVGLFSVLDAFLDEPMERVIAKLPLTDDIGAALTKRTGELGVVLDAALACERADWQGEELADFDFVELNEAYVAAISWADQTLRGFAEA
ncbi:MAG: EAL domain-containing protein [Planctomycetes bacterium]|nr:EAL domain-containing protein [Planctomycetota bacterium]